MAAQPLFKQCEDVLLVPDCAGISSALREYADSSGDL